MSAARVCLLLIATSWAGVAHARQDAPVPTLAAKEVLLAEIPAGVDMKSVVVSPDGKRVVYVQTRGDKQEVVLDGVAQKAFAGVAAMSLRFSPDSRRLAYVASEAGKAVTALGGGVQTRRFHVYATSVGRNPQGGGPVVLVLDGQESKTYSGIDLTSLTFSPDSRRFAFLGQSADRWRAVIDGEEQRPEVDDVAPYLEPPTIHFSPDSRRVAYVALRKEADGSKLGYRFLWFAVVDGQKGKEYDRVGGAADTLVFSPDGKRLGFVASARRDQDLRAFPVIDAMELPTENDVHSLSFAPDSRRVAIMTYREQSREGVLTKMSVVVDGVAGKERYQLQAPVFHSPDGARIAYVNLPAVRNSESSKASVVVDGKEGATYGAIPGPLVFSPDGKRLAYRAEVRTSKDLVLVVDGAEGPVFEAIPSGSPLIFTGDRSLYTVVRRGNQIFRVDVEIREP